MRQVCIAAVLVMAMMVVGCRGGSGGGGEPSATGKFPRQLPRQGTEIMVAGQLFDIGTPVVLWTDPGGYDAYRTELRFTPWRDSSWEATTRAAATQPARYPSQPNRYGLRAGVLNDEQIEQVKGGGWPLELLQQKVDQFVIHYDVCGTSQRCFFVLHDLRGLSVHFMLDIDGTIYQTMDLKERAWHAGTANTRSVGIEIANMGAYSTRASLAPLAEWYAKDANGQTYITIPERLGDGGVRVPGTYRPARNELIEGQIHGTTYRQYDLTPQQYAALIKLTAGLSGIFPHMKLDYPRREDGKVLDRALTREELDAWQGLLAHWHVTPEKQDPGPAFQWEYVVEEARKLLK
jgi:N-acetyl-anhydromuramyl-L-alanine amidase AmpD